MKAGWQKSSLGESCEMYQPKTISCNEMSNDGEYLVYGANGVIGRYNKYNHAEAQLLITCRGATCGAVNVSEPKSWINGNAMVIRPKDASIDLKLLEYIFRGAIDISKAITGAAQPQITRTNLAPLTFAYPGELTEQQRLVALLDEAFAGIDAAKANAEQNLNNARALFDGYLAQVFSQRGEDWEEKRLGDVYDVRDGTHDSPKYHATGFPLITSKNLMRDGLSFDDVKLIAKTDYVKINERSLVHKGDVLLAMIGTIGNPTVVTIEPNFAIKNVALLKVPSDQSSYFLKYYLESPVVKKKMLAEAKGTTQKFVGLGYLRDFPIPFPPLPDQQAIVAKLDALSAETKKLEAIYRQKIAALDELKQSLLHQAFTGEL